MRPETFAELVEREDIGPAPSCGALQVGDPDRLDALRG